MDITSTMDYILITNLMHWLLFIHKILFSSTCFEPQELIFRRIQIHMQHMVLSLCKQVSGRLSHTINAYINNIHKNLKLNPTHEEHNSIDYLDLAI